MIPRIAMVIALALTLGLLTPLPAAAQPPSPPQIVPAVSPPPNAAGWNQTPVTVTWMVSSALPIVSTVGCAPVTLTAETQGTVLTCKATNSVGGSTSVSVTVRIDRTPPLITGLPGPGCVLWPPNHRMVRVGRANAEDPLSGLVPGSLMVAGVSNEPEDGQGDGHTSPDIAITADHEIWVRAERAGGGSGRVYSLSATAVDLAGNRAHVRAACVVPHDQRFVDVPPTHFAWAWIEVLYGARVTSGCRENPLAYCPDAPVTREQMAVFLLKTRETPDYQPTTCTRAFADVPCSSPFAPWIEAMVDAGVTAGCGGGNFCPRAPVTREQMAVFLLKALGDRPDPGPCSKAPAADVPCSNPFAPWIQELMDRGIAAGCAPGQYCPSDPVTRAQMAVFLVKTFNLPL